MGIKMASPLPHPAQRPGLRAGRRIPGRLGIRGASSLWVRVRGRPGLPVLLLGLLCAVSLGARSAWIGLPCRTPCDHPADHRLIFDERYYVNAARVIAGLHPPAGQGAAYRRAPLGSDPNAEHPQLAKLIIAGSIEALGDGPLAWRLGSLVFGTLAILGMFVLTRAAGAGRWLALGSATLMAADNLMLVQGRIGTLDVYVVCAMVWAVALYLRGHPLLSGLVAGVGACLKLFALDALLVLLLFELLQVRAGAQAPRRAILRWARASAAAVAAFLGLLAVLDQLAPPYDNAAARFVRGGPFAHLAHMLSYAASQTGESASKIASSPWQWLVDYKPIVYLATGSGRSSPGVPHTYPAVHFLGLISPPILLAGLIGVGAALWRASGLRASPDHRLTTVAVAWFLGTFGPFLIASLAFNRTSYLYYMTIVMPSLYLAGAWLVHRLRRHVWLTAVWATGVVAAAVVLYPFTPLP
jgi:hypothetical protein